MKERVVVSNGGRSRSKATAEFDPKTFTPSCFASFFFFLITKEDLYCKDEVNLKTAEILATSSLALLYLFVIECGGDYNTTLLR